MEENIVYSYDLAQNFLFGEKLESLQHICVSSIVSFIFKSEEIIIEIVSLDLRKILDFEAVEDWDVTFKKVEEIALEQISSKRLHNLVREIVSFTASEIYTFLLKNKYFDRCLFLENFVYTTQGTINTNKTVLKILENKDLDIELKFKIACFYFVGMSVIEDCFNKVPEFSRIDILLCARRDMAMYVPISYWYFRLNFISEKEIETYLNEYFEECPITSYFKTGPLLNVLFVWAVLYANDVALSFLCQETELEPKKYLKELFFRKCFNPLHQGLSNIYIYLYFHKESGDIFYNPNQRNFLLQVILSHRWVCLLLKISKAFLKYLGHQGPLFILSTIIRNLRRSITKKISGKYRERLQNFINSIPPIEKYFIRKETEFTDLVKSVLHSKNKESFEIIHGIGVPQELLEKSDIFLPLLKELEFSLIDLFMEGISSHDAINFKKKIFLDNAKCLCIDFIFKDVSSLNLFLKWGTSFCSVRDIIHLKASIPYDIEGSIIRKILFNSEIKINGCKFKFADNVLFWCFENKDFVSIYKKTAVLNMEQFTPKGFNVYVSFFKEMKDSIFKRKWKFLNKLFLWASCSPEEVRSFKKEFKNDPKFLYLICQKNNIKLLQSFAEWCKEEDENEDETNEFRRELFRSYYNHVKEQIRNIKMCKNTSIGCFHPFIFH